MIDFINYYYNLYPLNINKYNDNYMFYIDNIKYYFIPYDRELNELDYLVKLNIDMINNGSLVHEIIPNKLNKILTIYENKYYILLKTNINDDKVVSIEDIMYMLNESKVNYDKNNILNRMNWSKLWELKIDYFEYQMTHIIKKYPILYNNIDYYIGIGENAIQYFNTVIPYNKGNIEIGICHKRINSNSTLFDLYNPLNLIIDYKVRDISEYIKSSYFNNNISNIIDKVFNRYYFDKLNLSLMISRLLFPSYFFDMFEDIVYSNVNENSINYITKKSSSYEDFINNLIKKCNLQSIRWLEIKQH